MHKSKEKCDRVKATIYFADNDMHRKMKHLLYSFDSYSCIKHKLYLKEKNLKREKGDLKTDLTIRAWILFL